MTNTQIQDFQPFDFQWVSDYLGCGWKAGACGNGFFDCWQLVVDVYKKQLGIELKQYGISANAILAVAKQIKKESIAPQVLWFDREEPRNLDLVTIASTPSFVAHVGLWLDVDGGMILHCSQNGGVACETISQLASKNFTHLKFYGHRDRN